MLIMFNSIVAVHGLGAHPKWAWVHKKEGGEDVNWLADPNLLPKKLSDAGIEARIMTFGYESKWIIKAPKTRRMLCAEELLTALSKWRKPVRII